LQATISALFLTYLWIFYRITSELAAWYATNFTIALVICVPARDLRFFTPAWQDSRCWAGNSGRIEFAKAFLKFSRVQEELSLSAH
jgi:hypothetical protein